MTNGLAERVVRRIKEGTSEVLFAIWLGREVVGGFHGILLLSIKTSYRIGQHLIERRLGESFRGPVIPFGSMIEYHSMSAKDQSRLDQLVKEVLPGVFLGYALYAGRIW